MKMCGSTTIDMSDGVRTKGAACLRRGWLYLLLLVGGSSVFVGCVPLRGLKDQFHYTNSIYEASNQIHNRLRADRVWRRESRAYSDEPHFKDFGAGFRQGYFDVACGENGCPPPLPPRTYWRRHYETPEGQEQIAAWYAGYPHGVRAAEQDLAGAFHLIRSSGLVTEPKEMAWEAVEPPVAPETIESPAPEWKVPPDIEAPAPPNKATEDAASAAEPNEATSRRLKKETQD